MVFTNSLEPITEYPSANGIYRCAAIRIKGLPNVDYVYGTLFIYGNGYRVHIYTNYPSGQMFWTMTEGSEIIPSEWLEVSRANKIDPII